MSDSSTQYYMYLRVYTRNIQLWVWATSNLFLLFKNVPNSSLFVLSAGSEFRNMLNSCVRSFRRCVCRLLHQGLAAAYSYVCVARCRHMTRAISISPENGEQEEEELKGNIFSAPKKAFQTHLLTCLCLFFLLLVMEWNNSTIWNVSAAIVRHTRTYISTYVQC